MKCIKCNKKIPKERLEALPNVQTCVKCSDVTKKLGVVVWDKNVPQLAILDEKEAQEYMRIEHGDARISRL